MKRFLFILILNLIPLYILSAQSFKVLYFEGYPILREGTEGHEIEMGERIPAEGVLILEDGDYIEMICRGNSIKLLQSGKYSLQEIYNNRILKPLGTGAHIINRFSRSQSDIKYDVVAGVRGEEQDLVSPGNFLDSFEDVDFEDFTRGMESYEAGDYQTALEYFREGMEWEGANYDALYLHSVLCNFQLNNMKEVQKSMEDHTVPEDSASYIEYMLFRINWQIEQFQFIKALDLLDTVYPKLLTVNDRQLSDFLYGCCYYSLYDFKSAGNSFTEALKGPSSEISEQSLIIYNSFKE